MKGPVEPFCEAEKLIQDNTFHSCALPEGHDGDHQCGCGIWFVVEGSTNDASEKP